MLNIRNNPGHCRPYPNAHSSSTNQVKINSGLNFFSRYVIINTLSASRAVYWAEAKSSRYFTSFWTFSRGTAL